MKRDLFVLSPRLEQKLFGEGASRCWTLNKTFLPDFAGRKGFVPVVSHAFNPSLIGGLDIKKVDFKKWDSNVHRGNVLVDPDLNPPIRVVSSDTPFVDKEYVRDCLREALAYRKKLSEEGIIEMNPYHSAFRLVHELGDGLTGLAIDIYGRYADIQTYSSYWNEFLPTIKQILLEPEFFPHLVGISIRKRFRHKRPSVNFQKNKKGRGGGRAEEDDSGEDSVELSYESVKRSGESSGGSGKGEKSIKSVKCVVTENGFNYYVDISKDSSSTGLFLDQKTNRKYLMEKLLKKGDKDAVLNTFAHTCAWSVIAAKMGAITTNIDVDKDWLELGRENYLLNGIDVETMEPEGLARLRKEKERQEKEKEEEEDEDEEGEEKESKGKGDPKVAEAEALLKKFGISLNDKKKRKEKKGDSTPKQPKKEPRHRFIEGDVFKELPRLTKFKTRYSVVVLDPPALARTSAYLGGIFSCKNDYARLVEAAAPLVAKNGYLLCFNNTRSKSASVWESEVMEGGLKGSSSWTKVETLTQSLDFRWKEGDERVGKYLKGLVVRKRD